MKSLHWLKVSERIEYKIISLEKFLIPLSHCISMTSYLFSILTVTTHALHLMHSGCLGDDLFDISKDHSRESYSSRAWSVRWKWQLFWRCEDQGRDGYSEEHGCIRTGGF